MRSAWGTSARSRCPFHGASEIIPYSNLMRSDAALNPDRASSSAASGGIGIVIRKASVLTRKVDDRLNGTFHVFVAKGGATSSHPVTAFVSVSAIHASHSGIRSRAWWSSSSLVHPNNIDDPNDALNMTIVLKNDSILIDVEPFGPGSLIYLPIPAPPPVASIVRPYLTLISPAAERIMNGDRWHDEREALRYVRREALSCGCAGAATGVDELEKHVPLRMWTRIAGAYYGGAKDACGILHASGSCFMRTGADGITLFCPACRFALVDRVDPEQHWRNDRDYEAEYVL